ncbi:MAG: Gfo/Idh/MocA family oxidoreductase [Verrucomicrobia bacterium]|nr:Gfo/Idh/MocA family oxidoreductase [Verrucomicrobiota bacterium]
MIRLAIIGTGGMANGHADSFKAIKGCELAACCDIVPGRAKAFAEKHGIPKAYTDAGKMLKKERLDGISIVTIDKAHAPIALLAIKYGLRVMCEKPLADNLRDARRMAEAARARKLITAVNFSYRNCPATQMAAKIAASGKLGRIMHVEGSYLQGWLVGKAWHKNEGLLWRLSTRHGSAGVLGDIGVHLFDFASFIVGDIAALQCELKTFNKGLKRIGPYVFDANDSMAAIVRFNNGALGTLHSSRWATGHANTVALRVYGNKGGLDINLDRPAPETLRICVGQDVDTNTWWPVKCPPVPDMYRRFIDAIKSGKQGQTSFEGGARVQAYLDASLKSSANGGKLVKIKN